MLRPRAFEFPISWPSVRRSCYLGPSLTGSPACLRLHSFILSARLPPLAVCNSAHLFLLPTGRPPHEYLGPLLHLQTICNKTA